MFTAYVERVNAGDLEAVMELFDDSATTVGSIVEALPGDRQVDSIRQYINEMVTGRNGTLKAIRVARADNWVYALLEVRSDMMAGLGVECAKGIDELEVKNNRITSFRFLPDATDPQTQTVMRHMQDRFARRK
ncbi:hypothetical protein GTY41_21865 [Streptomyces sp. SID685]|uniref:nuclear transport factor 2 family protein n=1 Tax=Streptomyces griseofuscus TaxID=146922 RepID=UPI0014065781|nr:hypothetical protein [Streptomyces sp. SID685]